MYTATTRSSGLDFQTIVKALQAISREIKLDVLLSSMMNILIENAGAEKGFFIQKKKGNLFITASGDTQKNATAEHQAVRESSELPVSLVHYVERTREPLVLNHAAKDKRFGQEAYIVQHQVRSLLCMPIIHQEELKAIIYLENNLTPGAFTADRLEVLNLLSAQIAISVDNALLYDQLEHKVEERTIQLRGALGELAKQNEDTRASINYARRIQEAMLSQGNTIQAHLPDSFIMLRPRDIVSGDFYWFARKDDKIIITAADCTGHGVPGALMSMIGHSLLSQIINEKNIIQADQVLNHLHKGVRTTLKQEDTENRDGMDLALCVIDLDSRIVEYAGAMNPLYYVQNGEFFEIKADRKPIGGRQPEEERVFTRHLIDISQPTTFYLCSDGFQDQFGGPQRKKFMVKHFRELLFSIHHHPMKQQQQMLETALQDWMTTQSQMDDVLVMGFRI